MITVKFKKLIAYLSTRNGTCAQELQDKVDRGELSEEEAVYVRIYALLQRTHRQVDRMMSRSV